MGRQHADEPTAIVPSKPIYVHHLIEALSEHDPSRCAIRHGARSLTRRDLTDRSKRLATYLLARGVMPGSVVAIRLDRSFEQIVGALAVLPAGCAFLNIDPADPVDRANALLTACQVVAIITDTRRAEDHDGLVIAIDGAAMPDIEAATADRLPIVEGHDLAYIIHTSGSTGTPNEVEIEHHSLLHLIHWTNAAFNITVEDRTSHAHGLGFDAVIWELWPALAAGATVHIIDDVVRTAPELLRDVLVAEEITIAFVPTALAEQLIALDWPILTPLRYVLTGGDVLRAYPREKLPFDLINNYGPAECTVQTTWCDVPVRPASATATELPTIGRPISGVYVYILDEEQQPAAPNQVGEMWIGGKSVGCGYRNRPELTARKFWPNPFSAERDARMYRTGDRGRLLESGEIAFCGRADRQVKIAGVRVELDEIALALQGHPLVGAAVVIESKVSGRTRSLVAYVIPRSKQVPTTRTESEISPLGLRQYLLEILPRSIVPSFYVMLDVMPLTRNGKIDYGALPAPQRIVQKEPGARALSSFETAVVGIVTDILGLEEVTLNENFLLLGGDSLLAITFVVRCRQLLTVDVAMQDIFSAGSIADLAKLIENGVLEQVTSMSDDEVRVMLGSIRGMDVTTSN